MHLPLHVWTEAPCWLPSIHLLMIQRASSYASCDHDRLGCRVHNGQKKTELEKLEKQLKIADQKLSSEGRQLDTLAHKVERLDDMREVRGSSKNFAADWHSKIDGFKPAPGS